eukprot:756512-Hanusia_phi.AAC.3
MRKPSQPQQSLEEELQLLLRAQKEGQGFNLGPGEENEVKEVKNRVRALKNRLAAKKSRDQARCYVQKLEAQISTLHAQNDGLSQQLSLATFKIQSLVAENERLKRRQRSDLKSKRDASIFRAWEAKCSGDQPSDTQNDVDSGSDTQSYHTSPVNYLVAEPHVIGVGLMTLEQWRKEKRRLQHREAQHKHKENVSKQSLVELKREILPLPETMENVQQSALPCNVEKQPAQISGGWPVVQSGNSIFPEVSEFPAPSLSRNSSNCLPLSRQNSFSQATRDGDAFWFTPLPYSEITTM